MKRLLVLIYALVVVTACTTMDSIQSKEPSYRVDYSGVQVDKLASCLDERSQKKTANTNRVKKLGDYTVIETFGAAYIPAGGGYMQEGAVPYFATRVYADRVEIYGRYNIWGDWGYTMIPVVEECVAYLGGSSKIVKGRT